MSILCKLGFHQWDGCSCIRRTCSKTRDEGHDWNGCKCKKCRQTRNEGHDWNGCKCKTCGKTRNEGHNWKRCFCEQCGAKRYDDAVVQTSNTGLVVRFGVLMNVVHEANVEFGSNNEDKIAIELACSAIGKRQADAERLWNNGDAYKLQKGVASDFESTKRWGSKPVYIVQILLRYI